MKQLIILTAGVVFLFFINPVMAYKYTDNDKDMFYTAFLDGYFAEMEKAVEKLDMTQEKKENFIKAIKANTNKKTLEDSSWRCITTYPIQQIVAASVICTADWTNQQAEVNKKLLEEIK